MSQKLTPDGGQKGFAVGRGLLAAAETLNYNMGESNPDPYSSTSQQVGGMIGFGGGDRQDHGSQLPSRVGSQLSNTVKLFSSLGLSPADLDALAQIPEEKISVETLPDLLMQLKNRKNLSGDPPSLSSDTSYRKGREDWGNMQGGRLDRSAGQNQGRASQSNFGYSSVQNSSSRGSDMLEYGGGSSGIRDRVSDLSTDHYHGLGMGSSSSSSWAGDSFMQRRMGAPSQGKIQDFLGVMPQMFPHVCALCDFDVHSSMEWNHHKNGVRHAENRKDLLQMYPDWDPPMSSDRMSGSFYDSKGRSDGILGAGPSGGARSRMGMGSNWGSDSGMGMMNKMQSYPMTPKVRSRVVVVKYKWKPVLSNLLALAQPFGTIREHLVLTNKAFLEFRTHEEALAMDNFYRKKPATLHGNEVHIYISKELLVIEKDDRADRDQKNVTVGTSPVVFFSNMPKDKKMELLTIARRFGTVEKHLFLKDEAFVQMSSADDAEMLVKYYTLNPLTIGQRNIRCNICTKYKNLRVPSWKGDQQRRDRDEERRKSNSRTRHRSRSPRTRNSKSKERSSVKTGETKPEKEDKEVVAEGSGNEDEEDQAESNDEKEGPAVEKSQAEETTEDQTNQEASLNNEDSVMEQAEDSHNAESTEISEEAAAKSEDPEADQNTTEKQKNTDHQDDMEQAETENENAPENLSELEGFDESDFPENMEDFVTLDELADEEDAEMHDLKSGDRSSGRSKQSTGLRVVNVIGFRRGYNYLNEILSLAKPFGKVVRHLVLNVRPEAFLELPSEQEAKAMVRFYSGNVTPSVCGKAVKIYHSHVYPTIQIGKVVYIGHIPPFKSSDASLLKIAEPFGKIRRYVLIRARGECLIEMERTEDAEKFAEAAKKNPRKFHGKQLVVSLSRKYTHLKHGGRPPTPEPEDKRPTKRVHSGEETATEVSKRNASKGEQPPTKKVKEQTSCTDNAEGEPAEEMQLENENQDETSESEAEAQNMERKTSVKKTVTTLESLEQYEPDIPVGVEFVKTGYYCRVCFLFYSNEDTAKKVHCSSQAHYDRLKKHLEKEKAKSQEEMMAKSKEEILADSQEETLAESQEETLTESQGETMAESQEETTAETQEETLAKAQEETLAKE